MKKIVFNTDNNWASLTLRVTLGAIVLLHGYDKLGSGFDGFMGYFTGVLGMPVVLGWLTVGIETLGCVLLIVGLATRINALLLLGLFVGMIVFVHWQDGFLMNWFGQMEKGHEGFEYHILVLAICTALMLLGGGKWSLDKVLFNAKSSSL
jgi:putative oxidoreductase